VEVSTEKLAAIMDLTPRRIQQLAKEGLPAGSGRGRWPLLECLHWYIRQLRLNKPEGTIKDERARLERAKADKVELEVAELKGGLISIEDANAAIQRILATLRLEMLGLPGRMAAQLATISNPARIKAIVDEEIRAALNRASEALAIYAGDETEADLEKRSEVVESTTSS